MISIQDLKQLFLSTDLFSPFRSHEDKLVIEVVDQNWVTIHLNRFPELDVGKLSPRALSEVQLNGVILSNFRVTSGCPDGITIQYKWEPR